MKWSLCSWVWQVEQPLYLGMPPAKSLNRCRLYLPARAMHGAVTAELARIHYEESHADFSESGEDPDYGKFGREVGVSCRFTYLYPAVKHNDRFETWLPEFDEKKGGLCWCKGGEEGEKISDREFRRQLLSTKASTAINTDSDAALDGSLHETECITTRWPKTDATISSAVYLSGYVFLRDNAFLQKLQNLETLWVGGDSRYGLGKIRRVSWEQINPDDARIFMSPVELTEPSPCVKADRVFAHAYSDLPLRGMKEILGGWNIKNPWKQERDYAVWVPGSSVVINQDGKNKTARWSIDTYGFWESTMDQLNIKTLTPLEAGS